MGDDAHFDASVVNHVYQTNYGDISLPSGAESNYSRFVVSWDIHRQGWGFAVKLLLTVFLSFTGYLLPWDQLALWAVTVGTNMMGYTPVFGQEVRFVLLGGAEIGSETLLRWYVLHVLFLPFVIVIFMVVVVIIVIIMIFMTVIVFIVIVVIGCRWSHRLGCGLIHHPIEDHSRGGFHISGHDGAIRALHLHSECFKAGVGGGLC